MNDNATTSQASEDGALAFMKRFCDGHRIVSSGALTELQIAEARAKDRFYVEPGGGLGWAALPWDLTTRKDRDRDLSTVSDHCRINGCVHAEHDCPTWPAGANPFSSETVPAVDNVARVRFCHDLEDGWYRAQLPDGRVIERNHWKDMAQELGGYALLWVGDTYYRPQAFPVRDASPEVDAFLDEVRAELVRARTKFPGDRLMTVAMAEEFGELCKAVLDEPAANVRKEAVQTAAMAARVVLDGDGSVAEWRAAKGLDPLVAQ